MLLYIEQYVTLYRAICYIQVPAQVDSGAAYKGYRALI